LRLTVAIVTLLLGLAAAPVSACVNINLALQPPGGVARGPVHPGDDVRFTVSKTTPGARWTVSILGRGVVASGTADGDYVAGSFSIPDLQQPSGTIFVQLVVEHEDLEDLSHTVSQPLDYVAPTAAQPPARKPSPASTAPVKKKRPHPLARQTAAKPKPSEWATTASRPHAAPRPLVTVHRAPATPRPLPSAEQPKQPAYHAAPRPTARRVHGRHPNALHTPARAPRARPETPKLEPLPAPFPRPAVRHRAPASSQPFPITALALALALAVGGGAVAAAVLALRRREHRALEARRMAELEAGLQELIAEERARRHGERPPAR
jgi:hypothetical protein